MASNISFASMLIYIEGNEVILDTGEYYQEYSCFRIIEEFQNNIFHLRILLFCTMKSQVLHKYMKTLEKEIYLSIYCIISQIVL